MALKDPKKNLGFLESRLRLLPSCCWYNAMILEALSVLKDANGSDLNVIINFIEVRL
ncbi:hypothetical protein AHAS_Ahas15G0163000 [Arachis hypogaea]